MVGRGRTSSRPGSIFWSVPQISPPLPVLVMVDALDMLTSASAPSPSSCALSVRPVIRYTHNIEIQRVGLPVTRGRPGFSPPQVCNVVVLHSRSRGVDVVTRLGASSRFDLVLNFLRYLDLSGPAPGSGPLLLKISEPGVSSGIARRQPPLCRPEVPSALIHRARGSWRPAAAASEQVLLEQVGLAIAGW